jgi:hypothetical protein
MWILESDFIPIDDGLKGSEEVQTPIHESAGVQIRRLGRHRLRSANYRPLRGRAFAVWTEVTAA